LTSATVPNTSSVTVQSSETGTAYLVKSTVTVTSVASITGAAGSSWNSVAITSANTGKSMAATGLVDGTYRLYATDAAGNLSAASSNTLTIDTTAPTATLTAGTTNNAVPAIVKSSEAGTAYLVNSGVAVTNLASITG